MRPIGTVILCPAGFEAIVADAARHELSKFFEERRCSGFIRARTIAPVRELREFPCATNVFAVIDEIPRSTLDRELAVLSQRLPQLERPGGLPKRGALRLRLHDHGRFTTTDGRLAAEMEHGLAAWSGLEVSRRGGSLEVWLLRRRDDPNAVLATNCQKAFGNPIGAFSGRRSAPPSPVSSRCVAQDSL